MDEHYCLMIESLKLDGRPLSFGHAVLIADHLVERAEDWHIAVLNLSRESEVVLAGRHELAGHTARGRRLSGSVIVDAITEDLGYLCLRGLGSLSIR